MVHTPQARRTKALAEQAVRRHRVNVARRQRSGVASERRRIARGSPASPPRGSRATVSPRASSTAQSQSKGQQAKRTIAPQKAGQKPITFRPGGLHRSLGVPQGQKIPASKMAAAKAGRHGPLAKKQANLATGALAAGRRTAAANRRRRS